MLRRWRVFASSSGLWLQLIDKRNSGIPSDRTTSVCAAPRSHRGATSQRPQTRCKLHTEVFPSRGWERLNTPPHPEIGVCLLKGEGCPTSLPIPAEGSPPDQCPALRPQPARLTRPRPGLGGASGEVGSGLPAWEGFVRGSGPRRGRSPRAPTADAPRLPRPRPPWWLPRTHSLRPLLHWDAAVTSAPGTPVAAASCAWPGARSQLQILLWLLPTASSSCPGSLGRAPPNPHGPTAAAAAWAVTVLGSLGPAGSAPPHSAAPPHSWPRPPAQAPPPPGRQSFFAAGSAPFPPLPRSAGRHHPCLGVCACLGPAAVSAGRPFCRPL